MADARVASLADQLPLVIVAGLLREQLQCRVTRRANKKAGYHTNMTSTSSMSCLACRLESGYCCARGATSKTP